jgi:2-dehydro-3-deoxygluconokinase
MSLSEAPQATGARQSLLVIGECMMELSDSGTAYQRGFAGDVYNTAVYAKRCHPETDVQILTAVGHDPVSLQMKAQWDREQIGHEWVMTAERAHPGIYLITTDDAGERSFTYWRRDSAATELMSLMSGATRQAISQFDTVYFSGITLAILSDEDKAAFISMIAELKAQGSTIAFDPNYRPVLWRDASHAAHWITQAYQTANIALPGLEDHDHLYGHQSGDDVRAFLQDFRIDEVILKAADAGVFGYQPQQEPIHLDIQPEPSPVDTTGAGDSFAGTYLAERLAGVPMIEAIRAADRVASEVVQHRGAIVDTAF